MEKYFIYGEKEIDHLKNSDEKMAKLIDKLGHINRSVTPGIYNALVDSIIGQQISTAAHVTIRKRIAEKFGQLTPEKVISIPDEELQAVGTSFRKIGYIKDLSAKVISGEFNPNALEKLGDEEVIKVLCSLKGVGKWTAEMMMTFSLQRPDIISYGDLAIRRGIMKLYNLDRLSQEDFNRLTDKFAPYRTVRALYIWEYANPACDFIIK